MKGGTTVKKQVIAVVAAILGASFGIAILLFIPRLGIVSHTSETVSSELNLVAFLGTIMGAMMAASGIIIALVSLYSLFAVEQRTEQKFAQLVLKQQVAQEEHIRRMFQAFAYQLEAVSTNDLEHAQDLMQSAIDLYRKLEGARRQIGLRLYEATELWFLGTNLKEILSNNQVLWQNPSAVDHLYAPAYSNMVQVPIEYLTLDGDFSSDTQKWLEMALENGEDSDGKISLCLAKLYAIKGRRGRMMKYLEQASKLRNCTPDSIEETSLYLQSCTNAEDISELSRWLHWHSPFSKQDFHEWVIGQVIDIHRPSIEVLALRKDVFLMNRPRRIFKLRLFKLKEEGAETETYQMQWEKENRDNQETYIRMPKNESDKMGFSFEELWKHIDEMCILVSTID